MGDYFDEEVRLGTGVPESDLDLVQGCLRVQEVRPVLVPRDCIDGFGGAFWARPEAYLDPIVQEGMSSFAQLDPEIRRRGTEHLRRDLESGAWDARHGELRAMSEIHKLVLMHGIEKARELVRAQDRHLVEIAAETLADETASIGTEMIAARNQFFIDSTDKTVPAGVRENKFFRTRSIFRRSVRRIRQGRLDPKTRRALCLHLRVRSAA